MPGRATGTDTELQGLIDLAKAGDSASREEFSDLGNFTLLTIGVEAV